jgi:hypothetical protein
MASADFTAAPNASYLLSGEGPLKVTLPLSASLAAGDVLRLSSAGTAWQIVQDANQSITGTPSAGWLYRASLAPGCALAASADGTKLVEVGQPGIFTSVDSGATWVQRVSDGRQWLSVASSANGDKLVAGTAGKIYTSTDSGVTWVPHDSDRDWMSVSSSDDGKKLVAGASDGIYTSVDSGETWTAHESGAA